MSECNVREQLKMAMKDAMRHREKDRLGTIRMALAELQRIEVDEKALSDDRALAILDKMVKQRRDAATQYQDAGRLDLAEKEKQEMAIIQTFLPEALSEDELNTLIIDAISKSNAQNMQDMGKVMAIIKPKAQGRADMGVISKAVREKLC
ncbi:hypothetical protein CI610_02353 [invertebrate metagenome]|uniref:GatB/YqeY domain-containing protein n=1 Tax=invertebrate metagenome TaxID=1711999 RepID=A0A2H9T655_9ZZZZ